MNPDYLKGVEAALQKLGFLQDGPRRPSRQRGDLPETHGNPYPSKAKTIQAERLADLLQQDDTATTHQSADNSTRSKWNRPVTWSSPIDLTGIDQGQPVAGVIVPANPRS